METVEEKEYFKGKPGPGRPKGSKDKKTLDRESIHEKWKDHMARRATQLSIAQLTLAYGSIKIMRIDTEIIGSGKNEKRIKKKPVIVENTDEIIAALDYYHGQGEDPNTDTEYYFIATKEPDNAAIKDIMDRTFGKPKESVAVEHSGVVGLADLLGKGALDTQAKQE